MPFDSKVPGVTILAKVTPEYAQILTPEALQFIATLHRSFNHTRKTLLQKRVLRQQQIDQGILPDFLPETAAIREDVSWRGAIPAPGLADRRVEITGPVDRKMVINALNSGAATFMADFEGTFLFQLFITVGPFYYLLSFFALDRCTVVMPPLIHVDSQIGQEGPKRVKKNADMDRMMELFCRDRSHPWGPHDRQSGLMARRWATTTEKRDECVVNKRKVDTVPS